MNNLKIMLMFITLINIAKPVYSVKFELTAFRLNRYVYYEILHKVEGVAISELDNVSIIQESSLQLVFEYAGKRYEASNLSSGTIYVKMPEGRKDRYLVRKTVPSII